MNNKFIFLTGFILGAIVGGSIVYIKKNTSEWEYVSDNNEEEKAEDESKDYIVRNSYDAFEKKRQHTQYNNLYKNEEEKKENNKEEIKEMNEKTYPISQDEFGDFYDYETIELTYYNDGIVVDDADNIVDDIEEVLGEHYIKYIEDDSIDVVYFRNDARKCDYEILKDSRNYEEEV